MERLLLEFDDGWTPQRLRDAAASLPAEAEWADFALRELVKVDLERQWRSGSQRLVESYLAQYPRLGTRTTASPELLVAEYDARIAAGLRPEPAEFRERFPALHERFTQLLEGRRRTQAPRTARETLGSRSTESVVAAGSPKSNLPEQFGRYRILQKLGEGAMGSVHLAHDTQLDRRVAIKTPLLEGTDRREAVQRFEREARAVALLRHANICPVHDVGEVDGVPYLCMAFIDGPPLTRFIDPGRPQRERTLAALVRKLALALDHAHGQWIVHRDLKPSNILVDGGKEPMVLDFGLARRFDGSRETQLTHSGTIIGTPAYMSPEQIEGKPEKIGPACDVYSLGVIFYECLTGRLPFDGPMLAVLRQIATEDPPPPSDFRPDLDPRLEAVCLRMMAKRVPDRYASMKEVAADLTAFLKDELPPSDDGLPEGIRSTESELPPPVKRRSSGADPVRSSGEARRSTRRSISAHDGLLAGLAASEEEFDVPEPPGSRRTQRLTRRPEPKRKPVAAYAFGGGVVVLLLVLAIAAWWMTRPPQHPDAGWSVDEDGSGVAVVPAVEDRNSRIRVTVAPADAKVLVTGNGATIEGVGVERVVTIDRLAEDHELVATREGYGTELIRLNREAIANGTLSVVLKPVGAPSTVAGPAEGGPKAKLEGTNAGEGRHDNGLGMELVWCPPGTFVMGSPKLEEGRAGDEDQVRVTLTKGYWLGRTEVTQSAWRSVMGTSPWTASATAGNGPTVAATQVTWNESVEFCRGLTQQERTAGRVPWGWEFRLPTEAEWEYACRAGTTTRYAFGNDPTQLEDAAWYKGNASDAGEPSAHTVGLKKPNAWGLVDMHGNVWEWCLDCYATRLPGGSDPFHTVRVLPGTFGLRPSRIHRGGAWDTSPTTCRSAFRGASSPNVRIDNLGFRVVLAASRPEFTAAMHEALEPVENAVRVAAASPPIRTGPTDGRALRAALLGTRWRNTNNFNFEWDAQGRVWHRYEGNQIRNQLPVTYTDRRHCKVTFGSTVHTLEFSEDFRSFRQLRDDGSLATMAVRVR